jgi:serine/threonine-protein kinase
VSFIGKSVGNYQLESLLGTGAMGEVYLARHVALGRRAAVKVLKPELTNDRELVARFFQEAKAMAGLGHVNLVDVIDYGVIDETVYLTMEFLEGRTLAEQLQGAGVTIAEALHITAQACDALDACHGAGIIHRDLKPENVFLIKKGGDKYCVKLLDFGVAKLVRGATVKTMPGQLFGTPVYMSPEQAEGRSDLDLRTDLYALGVMLYEMLTGEGPFEDADSTRAMLLAHLTRQPSRPSSKNPLVPAPVDALVMKALEKKRDIRFQTAREMMRALEKPQAYWPTANAPETLRNIPAVQIAAPVKLHGEALSERRRSQRGSQRGRRLLRRKRDRWLRPVLAGGIVALATLTACLILLRSPSGPTAQRAVAAAKTARAKLVQIRISTTPDGASVLQDGVEIGESPLTLSARQGQTFDLELRLAHHRTVRKQLVADNDTNLVVPMTAQREAEPTQDAPTAAPQRKRRSTEASAKSGDKKADDSDYGLLPTQF